jgi:hypothetical protein
LFDEVTALFERANFKRLAHHEIAQALAGASDWGINMEIDFDIFERLEVFARGDGTILRQRRRLRNFYRLENAQVPTYRRLAVVLKLKDQSHLGRDINTAVVYAKLFKNIPKLDLEMLLPGARLSMPKFERGKLGASLASAVGFVAYKIYLDLSLLANALATLNPLAFWGPFSLICGYGYKQYAGYQATRQSYSLMLTQSLYFQNLDNNAGVFTHLIDEAEEQECREAVLAYYFLWRCAGEQGWSASQLDDHVEQYLQARAGIRVDFEIEDALAKLTRLGVAKRIDDRYKVMPLDQALEHVDGIWDNYFQYHQPMRAAS